MRHVNYLSNTCLPARLPARLMWWWWTLRDGLVSIVCLDYTLRRCNELTQLDPQIARYDSQPAGRPAVNDDAHTPIDI